MDNQDSLSVVLLHLVRRHQVSHAHRLPARFAVPQHRVQSWQQRSDVSLLPFNPVQDLQRDSKLTACKHRAAPYREKSFWSNFIHLRLTCNFSGSMSFVISCLLISAMVLGPFLSGLEAKPWVESRSSKSSSFTFGLGPAVRHSTEEFSVWRDTWVGTKIFK